MIKSKKEPRASRSRSQVAIKKLWDVNKFQPYSSKQRKCVMSHREITHTHTHAQAGCHFTPCPAGLHCSRLRSQHSAAAAELRLLLRALWFLKQNSNYQATSSSDLPSCCSTSCHCMNAASARNCSVCNFKNNCRENKEKTK